MHQILKFGIEIFDVRMRTSISVIDDSDLVKNIQINKGVSLDNTATITFSKSKTYNLLPMETILKLYNYVKIELELKNYNPSNLDSEGRGEKFYFSGFIQTINKSSNFGSNPSATVTITISDYANLLKTTFYTKNLTFLEILNQAVPEFRLINLTEYLGDSSKKLLDDFYTPTQLGFVFFTFLFFKFMYKILYNDDGSTKKTSAPESKEIFKKFKIYMPFGFDVSGVKSMFEGQEQTITIYKQLQGVALDLFKYIYPEPIFEFSTFETIDSVILMIRLTPFMKFDRPQISPTTITFGQSIGTEDTGITSYKEKKVDTQGTSFFADSYHVIDRFDFGFKRIKSCREALSVSPASLLRDHLEEKGKPKPKRIITTIQDAIGYSKNLQIVDLIANDIEADAITNLFFEERSIDTRFLETMNQTRSANSVVNVIWTVPTTDTSILKMSGRELVYSYLEEKLNKIGGADKFGNYIIQQFNQDFDPNPVFLMDYRGVFGQNFISGDMNFFGLREFEIKWNYLSLNYNTTAYILSYVDKKVLKEAKERSKDTVVQRMIDEGMRNNSDSTTMSSYIKNGKIINPRKRINESLVKNSMSSDPNMTSIPYIQTAIRQTSRAGNLSKPSQNKKASIDEAKRETLFKDALDRYSKEAGLGVLDKKTIQNADTIVKLLEYAKEKDKELMGGFVSKINGIVSEAYRENEHLYDNNIVKPIDLSILPGMVVKSSNESLMASSIFFKGYVTSISHMIDFNAATMKTSVNISRSVSEDSTIIGGVSVAM